MIKSMTGFGQAMATTGEGSLIVEVKSLNSKFLDLSLRLNRVFSDKEPELRNLVSEKLERGKISLSIDFIRTNGQALKPVYDEALFISYYAALKKLADRVLAPYDNLFEMALKSPGVADAGEQEKADAALYKQLLELMDTAMKQCDSFRAQEGVALAKKMEGYADSIQVQLAQVGKLDPMRIDRIRERIRKNIRDFFGEEGFDANRMEQEIIFYIEKLDIAEERVRLGTHLDYFRQVMNEKQSNGKKLAFISQEMGREINTIGSKANDAEIQRCVVVMKEELEKIKEQLNNVL